MAVIGAWWPMVVVVVARTSRGAGGRDDRLEAARTLGRWKGLWASVVVVWCSSVLVAMARW